MKVLVIGSGAREHAIVWKCVQSDLVERVFCAPGNGGTGGMARNIAIAPTDVVRLVSFAKQMGGELLKNVGQVIPVQMELVVNAEHHGAAMLRAGQFATVQTRSIGDKDHLCGNEVTYYQPLTQLTHAIPAVALTDAYSGPGLGVSWDLHGKRSAFVGAFVR